MTSGWSARCASGSPTLTGPSSALVNPLLPDIERAGFPGYWWVIDQCEYASDVLFTDRAALEAIQGDLVAVTALGATDVLHFLAAPGVCRRGHDRQQTARARLPGTLPPQAVKFYDHANVFRVETTINNPREFKVLRSPEGGTDQPPRWCPMGVANFWRYAEVAAVS